MYGYLHVPALGLAVEARSGILRVDGGAFAPRCDLSAAGLTLGPGPEIVVWSADGRLRTLGAGGAERLLLRGVVAADGDARCLAVLLEDGTLILQGRRAATSVGVGTVPQDLAVWGGDGTIPHLVALIIRGEVCLFAWDEGTGRLTSRALAAPPASRLWLLGGSSPLLLLRGSAGPADRLVPLAGSPGRWFGRVWEERPPLFLAPTDRSGAAWDGRTWACLAGAGGWWAWSEEAWEPCPDPAPPSDLMGRRFGEHPAVGPQCWKRRPSMPKAALDGQSLGTKEPGPSGGGWSLDSRLAPSKRVRVEWPPRRDPTHDALFDTAPPGRLGPARRPPVPDPSGRPGGH